MRTAQRTRVRRAAALLPAGALLVAVGCEDDRASVFDPVGPRSIDFTMSPVASLAAGGLPEGDAEVGAATATVTVTGLGVLSGGVYQFWGVSRDANGNDVYTKAFGTVREIYLRADTNAAGDTVIDPITNEPVFIADSNQVAADAATYSGVPIGADSVFEVRVVLDSLEGGATTPDGENTILVTLETAEASTPGPARFLWRRIGPGGDGPLSFGNYAGTDPITTANPADYVFTPAGSGRGGFRGDLELSVDFLGLPRPPVGFYYRGVVVDTLEAVVLVDTLRSSWDPVTAYSRVNLLHADTDPTLPDVAGPAIVEAQLRNCPTGAAVAGCQNTLAVTAAPPFSGLQSVLLLLVPKTETGPGGGVALAGTVPEPVRAPPES